MFSNSFCSQRVRMKMKMRMMKMQRSSTGCVSLWSGKVKHSTVRSLACHLHHPAPVTPAGEEPTHPWFSRTTKKFTPTLSCWPRLPKPGAMKRKRRRRRRRKDALQINLHKHWILLRRDGQKGSKRSSSSCLYIAFLFGRNPSMFHPAVTCCVFLNIFMYMYKYYPFFFYTFKINSIFS